MYSALFTPIFLQTPYDSLECEHNRKRAEKTFASMYKAHAGLDTSVSVQVAHGSTTWDADVTRYMEHSAILSAVNEKTLQFLRDKMKRKVWEDANITRIIVTFEQRPNKRDLLVCPENSLCHVLREKDTVTFKFFRRAVDRNEELNLHDALEFGMSMQEVITGKCYHKSGWVLGFNSLGLPEYPPVKQWFQCRLHCIYFYPHQVEGWSWRGGSPADDFPVCHDESMSLAQKQEYTRERFYTLPGVQSGFAEALPQLPNLPVEMTPGGDIAEFIPQVQAAAPDAAMVQSNGEKKRPHKHLAPHGRIQLAGAKVCSRGAALILSNAEVLQFWDAGDYKTTYEVQGKRKFILECESEEQAKSWV